MNAGHFLAFPFSWVIIAADLNTALFTAEHEHHTFKQSQNS
jgi:hypothetical protein